MKVHSKGVVGVVLGGLMLSGIAYAATKPALTPIVSQKEPNVVVKTAAGTISAVSSTSITIAVPAKGKVAAASYTFTLNGETKYYYRNSVLGTVGDLNVGDTAKVWSIKLDGGTAIKVWDKKLWIGSKTGRVESLVTETITNRTGGTDMSTATFTLRYNKGIAYDAYTTTTTEVVREVTAATKTTPVVTTAATLADLHNATATAAATRITVTGLWNDAHKILRVSRILIKASQ